MLDTDLVICHVLFQDLLVRGEEGMIRKSYKALNLLLVLSAALVFGGETWAGFSGLCSTTRSSVLSFGKKPSPGASPSRVICPYKSNIFMPLAACWGTGFGARPATRSQTWVVAYDTYFARVKGKVRFVRNMQSFAASQDELDLNSDLAIPDNHVMKMFMVAFNFRPRWSIQYSFMPVMTSSSGDVSRTFVFGNRSFSQGQQINVKWERFIHRVSLAYSPMAGQRSGVVLKGGYMQMDHALALSQTGTGGSKMAAVMHLALMGVEFRRLLKVSRHGARTFFVCKAGTAFGYDTTSAEFEASLRYVIPLGAKRRGFLAGGYRYRTARMKPTEFRMLDLSSEGGFLQLGLRF